MLTVLDGGGLCVAGVCVAVCSTVKLDRKDANPEKTIHEAAGTAPAGRICWMFCENLIALHPAA